MKSKTCLAFCSLLLFVLLTPKVTAQHPTPTAQPTAHPSDSPIPTATPAESVTPGDNSCCGTKPPLKDIKNYAATYGTFTGQIAVATTWDGLSSKPAVVIWDLKNQATAPRGVQWTTTSSPQTNFYSHSSWTGSVLGDLFGLTLDNKGNIYVAATRIYSSNKVGSNTVTPGVGGHGDIYKLDANTGMPSRFVQTDPNPVYTSGSNKIPNTGPGIGNIHYSCQFDRIYATNFEDGMIYCIRLDGSIQSLWDHGGSLGTIPDTGSAGFTPLGRRTVAIQTFNGRAYYSVSWNNNQPVSTHLNEIWSVGLNATGDFTGPLPRLEISVPALPGSTSSNPVFDISFSPSGNMLLAERTMTSDVSSSAHSSRVLEYTWNGAAWVATPNNYKIGVFNGTNAAGGCDYDWGVGGLMWATADAVHYPAPYIYGLQGTPTSGTPLDVTRSILIDLDNDVTKVDKMWLGDVEIPCPGGGPTPTPTPVPESCSAVAKEITCKKDGSGYSVDLVVTNNTGQPVIDVLLASPPGSNYTVAPAHAGPVADHASINVPVTITGGKPGDKVCFTVTFMGKDGCLCTIKICLVLPDCCAILNNDTTKIVCNKDGTYTFTTTITNNSGSPKSYIYLYPTTPGTTMTPDHFTMTQPGGLPPGGVFQTPPIIIKGIKSGEFCFDISLHNEGMEGCCISPHHCIKLHPCK